MCQTTQHHTGQGRTAAPERVMPVHRGGSSAALPPATGGLLEATSATSSGISPVHDLNIPLSPPKDPLTVAKIGHTTPTATPDPARIPKIEREHHHHPQPSNRSARNDRHRDGKDHIVRANANVRDQKVPAPDQQQPRTVKDEIRAILTLATTAEQLYDGKKMMDARMAWRKEILGDLHLKLTGEKLERHAMDKGGFDRVLNETQAALARMFGPELRELNAPSFMQLNSKHRK